MKLENHGFTESNNITQPTGTLPENHRPDDAKPVIEPPSSISSPILDVQVKAGKRSVRRKFSTAYKVKILAEYEAYTNALARGELLRKEGLYHSRLSAWRKQRDEGKLSIKPSGKSPKLILINQQLTRENVRLKKQLLQAHAIIDIQKKVSELLGIHAPQTNSSETS